MSDNAEWESRAGLQLAAMKMAYDTLGPCYEEIKQQLAATRERLAAVEAERDRLAAIVDKLPKTADGVPVVPGMRLWVTPYQSFIATTIHYKEVKYGSTRHGKTSGLYSTREAAGKARGE